MSNKAYKFQLKKLKISLSRFFRALVKQVFLVFLILVLTALVFGFFLFYKYSVLFEKTKPEVKAEFPQFKEVFYQKILTESKAREERFKKVEIREHLNPFQLKADAIKKEKDIKTEEDLEKEAIVKKKEDEVVEEGAFPKILINFVFETDLYIGMIYKDVKKLQLFLNINPETQVAKTGNGSPGQETYFFCWATYDAVIYFQEKYEQEILVPLGATKGTGFFGSNTRAKINKLLRH